LTRTQVFHTLKRSKKRWRWRMDATPQNNPRRHPLKTDESVCYGLPFASCHRPAPVTVARLECGAKERRRLQCLFSRRRPGRHPLCTDESVCHGQAFASCHRTAPVTVAWLECGAKERRRLPCLFSRRRPALSQEPRFRWDKQTLAMHFACGLETRGARCQCIFLK